jgi:hypothetical protein
MGEEGVSPQVEDLVGGARRRRGRSQRHRWRSTSPPWPGLRPCRSRRRLDRAHACVVASARPPRSRGHTVGLLGLRARELLQIRCW